MKFRNVKRRIVVRIETQKVCFYKVLCGYRITEYAGQQGSPVYKIIKILEAMRKLAEWRKFMGVAKPGVPVVARRRAS